MGIRVVCSGCGKQYDIPKNLAGKKIRCKKCQTEVTVFDDTNDAEPDPFLDALDEATDLEAKASGVSDLSAKDFIIVSGLEGYVALFSQNGMYLMDIGKHPLGHINGIRLSIWRSVFIGGLIWISGPLGIFLSGGFYNYLKAPYLLAKESYEEGRWRAGYLIAFFYGKVFQNSGPQKVVDRFPTVLISPLQLDNVVKLLELEIPFGSEVMRVHRLRLKYKKVKIDCVLDKGADSKLVISFKQAARKMLGNPEWRLPFKVRSVDLDKFSSKQSDTEKTLEYLFNQWPTS